MLNKWLALLAITTVYGCSHPFEIEGQGDVISASGERDCLLENQPCSHLIISDYEETYTATPRAGFEFSHWENCGGAGPQCSIEVDASDVQQFWGQTAATTRAIFVVDNGGTSVDAAILASRDDCVSPCTVIFSAEGTTDENRDHEDAWQDLGYHFDFDDATSGDYSTTGLTRTRQIGGPIAAHTFVCEGAQACNFNVGVRAENPEGDHDDAFVMVTVEPATVRYSAADTLCVSTVGNFAGCPAGAAQQVTLPTPTNYSGRRVLLRHGEVFDPICINYSASRVLIEPFGNPADGRPELTGISSIGMDQACNDRVPSDVSIGAIDGSSGYPEHWADQITLTGLRIPYIAFGMSYNHVGLHDIDMLFENEPSGGAVSLVQNTRACLNTNSLTCANIPYPVGAYLSQVHITQSDAEILSGSAPFGVNIGAFNCPIINWLALLESSARNSVEHNFRSEGTWRSFHGHNVIEGHHHRDPPGEGVRQKITVRACGIAEIDPQQAVYRHSTVADEDGPMTRYTVIADNILGSTDDFGYGARITMAPTTAASVEVVSFGIAERNLFLESPDVSLATNDGRLGGYNLACRDNIEATPAVRQGCVDIGPASVPLEWYNEAAIDDVVPPVPLAPQN